jgi:hypothetical protein
MRKGLELAVIALGMAASAAWAQEKVTVTGLAAHPYDPMEVVCKNAAPPVGSRIGRGKVCHTNERWRVIRMDSDDDIRIMQDRDAWQTHMHQ